MYRGRSQLWFAVALLLGLTGWFFGRAIVFEESFAFRDAAHYYYPLFHWCCEEWGAGRVPVWNPLENIGEPIAANATASVFYPGKLLFAATWFIFPTRFVLYTIGHVLLAACGAYFAARCFRASCGAAVVAGLSYAFSGNVLFQYCNVVFLVGAAWLPFALVATDRMLRGRRWQHAVGLGAVLAMMTLGGDPQAAYHAGLMAAGYAVLLWFRQRRPDQQTVTRVNSPWLRSQPVLLGIAAGSGLLLAAVQIVPAIAWTRASDRATFHLPRNVYESLAMWRASDNQESAWSDIRKGLSGPPDVGLHDDHTYDFSVGPWRLVEFLWPNAGGKMFPENRRWMSAIPAEGRVWTPSLYLGLIPLLSACGVCGWRRGPVRMRWLSWTVLLAIIGSFGWYGAGWVLHELLYAVGSKRLDWLGAPVGGLYWLMVTLLPGYVYFRYPAKLLVIATLALSLLAAIGWDRAKRSSSVRRRYCRRMVIAVAVSGLGIILAILVRTSLLNRFEQAPVDEYFGALDARGAWNDLVIALSHGMVASGVGWCLLRPSVFKARSPRGADFAVAVVVAIDLAVANGWMIVTAPSSVWEQPSPFASELFEQEQAVPVRVYRAASQTWYPWQNGGDSINSDHSVPQPRHDSRIQKGLRWERAIWFPKYALLDDVAVVESPGTMMNADFAAVLQAGYRHGTRRSDKARLLDPHVVNALGTDAILAPRFERQTDSVPGSERDRLPASLAGAQLTKISSPWPKAWIVHEVEFLDVSDRRDWQALRARTEQVWYPGGRPRDFRQVAIVETDGMPDVQFRQPGDSDGGAVKRCDVLVHEPTRVVIESEATAAGLLVLNDLYWPDWQVCVDGAPTAVWRTNRVMRGVWLEAGTHRIEMSYQPRALLIALAVSVLAWTLLSAMLIFSIRDRFRLRR